MLIITGFGIWYLCGMPGGRLPGTYNPQTGYYCFENPVTGTRISNIYISGGYGTVRVLSPLGNPDSIFLYPYELEWVKKRYRRTPYRRVGLIDSTGKIILPLLYDRISYAGKGKFIVENKGLKGLFSATYRKMLLPMKYSAFIDDYISFKYYILRDPKGLYGMTDSREGRMLVPCKYERCFDLHGYAIFGRKTLEEGLYDYDVYDYNGNLIFSGTYESLFTDSSKLPFFQARKAGKTYFINKETLEARKVDFI